MADQPPKTASPESGDDEPAADSVRDSFEWTTEPEKSLLFNMIRLKPSGPCLQCLCDNTYYLRYSCKRLYVLVFLDFSWYTQFKKCPIPTFLFLLISNYATDTIGYIDSSIIKSMFD